MQVKTGVSPQSLELAAYRLTFDPHFIELPLQIPRNLVRKVGADVADMDELAALACAASTRAPMNPGRVDGS